MSKEHHQKVPQPKHSVDKDSGQVDWRGQKTYLLHREGPDDVLRQQLSLYQRHLDVSVDLSVIRPVLAALHLGGTKVKRFHGHMQTHCTKKHLPSIHAL